jgi:hypothetical protein
MVMIADSGFSAVQKTEIKKPRELRGPENHHWRLLRWLLRPAATHIAVAAATTSASAAPTLAGTFVEFFPAAAATTALVFTLTLRTSAAHFGLAAAAAHHAHAAALLGIRRTGTIA